MKKTVISILILLFVCALVLAGCEKPPFTDWSESLPKEVTADRYEIEEKTEYRFSTKVRAKEQSDDPDFKGPEGSVLAERVADYEDWSAWGTWSDEVIVEDELTEVSTREANYVKDKATFYVYRTFKYEQPENGTLSYTYDEAKAEHAGDVTFDEYRSETPLPLKREHVDDGELFAEFDLNGESAWFYPLRLQDGTIDYYPQTVEEAVMETKTQYRARTRGGSFTYEFYLAESTGDYSEWSETKPAPADDKLIESRVSYRWRKK